MILGIIRQQHVLAYASVVCGGMLASVNSMNSVNSKDRQDKEITDCVHKIPVQAVRKITWERLEESLA